MPNECSHNGHIYYILQPNIRNILIEKLKEKYRGNSHYIPLHNSAAGIKYGKSYTSLKNTTKLADSIIRLIIWIGLGIKNKNIL